MSDKVAEDAPVLLEPIGETVMEAHAQSPTEAEAHDGDDAVVRESDQTNAEDTGPRSTIQGGELGLVTQSVQILRANASPTYEECALVFKDWANENEQERSKALSNIRNLEQQIKQTDERLAERSFWTKMIGRSVAIGAIILGFLGYKVLGIIGGSVAHLVFSDGELRSYLWGRAKKRLEGAIAPKRAEYQNLLDQKASIDKAMDKLTLEQAAAQANPGKKSSRRRRRRRGKG